MVWFGSDLAVQGKGAGPALSLPMGLGILAAGRDGSSATAPPPLSFPNPAQP